MAGVGTLISSLLSKASKLLPEVKNSLFAPSSSSSSQSPNPSVVEDDLNKLIRTLKRIKATLYDAEEREIQDESVKLWLKELKEVGRDADFVIDEYMYEVYRAQVEAINISEWNPHKRKHEESSIRVPDGFVDRIREIRSRFEEIAKDREALQLCEGDGLKSHKGVKFRMPSSHLILEPIVFGRENDKEKVIDLLFSNINEGVITILPIIGKGGLGKTTLAQLVYNDKQVKQKFDLFGWVYVSEDLNIERLMQELIESFTGNNCFIKNLGILQEKVKEIVAGKKVFVVLDDVWDEDKNLWELFRAPFMSALKAALIVTTRSNRVAKIVQTNSSFQLGYLSEEDSWFHFRHNAFGDNGHNVHPNLLNLGKQITKKCNGLPLALKSVSNILRYEDEESWVEILENDLWELYSENDIFGILQISYTRLPTHLRPCFLYCSLFPKGYKYKVDELVELWINEGYVGSKRKRNMEDIALEYVLELKERSFFDPIYDFSGTEIKNMFKIHDMVHDLARLNSGNEFYSIERGKQPNLPDEVLHIYLDNFEPWNNLNINNITRLRTLVLEVKSGFGRFDLSKAKKLRVLKLQNSNHWENFLLPHFVFPKHLRFLDVSCAIGELPLFSLYRLERLKLNLCDSLIDLKALGDLINLQSLYLSYCQIERFPDTIGNLVRLQKLVIRSCDGLCLLPESLCKISGLKTLSLTDCPEITKLPNDIGNLTNLQTLIILRTGINNLPPSFSKLNVSHELNVQISLRLDGVSDTITCIKDFDNFKGVAAILDLWRMPSIEDACNFNLIRKSSMEKLILSWSGIIVDIKDEKHNLEIGIRVETEENYMHKTSNIRNMELRVLENLQPHPNLKHLQVHYYNNPIFPLWIGDPLSCASLEELQLYDCTGITHLPFGNLTSLKRLKIWRSSALGIISRESLPLHLESLIILYCDVLGAITGLKDLESLVEVEIDTCYNLGSFPFELISEECCHKPLKKLKINRCRVLQLAVNEVVPSADCNFEISNCMGLKKWCQKHNIRYGEW